jgi:hypothetical protein
MRDGIATAHRQGSQRYWVYPRNPSTSRGCTDRGIGKAVHVLKTLRCQLIDIGSLGMGIPVTPNPVHIVVLTGDPKNVGAFRPIDRKPEEQTKKDEQTGEAIQLGHGHIFRNQNYPSNP